MFLETAIKAAQKAGDILVESYGQLKKDQVSLKGARDFVTEIDKKSEKEILNIIQSQFPDHSILAEESGIQENNSDYQWIIDPLDGTVNYIHEFPIFCVSIGMEYQGKRKIGVVYDPLRQELFSAEQGQGAHLNGKKISVTPITELSEAILATGFPFRIHDRLDNYLQMFKSVFQNVSGIRRGGSAAIDLAYTACGRFDGFWEMGLSPWDISAGLLLIEEAGGLTSGFDGNYVGLKTEDIICGAPKVQTQLLNLIKPLNR